MKTKIFSTAFLVFAIIVNTFSQEYHPLLNHSSWITWASHPCCSGATINEIEEGTDEVIGSVTYKKFIEDNSANYLREDISERKVYILYNGSEVLLYDFNLENSDTIFYGGYHFTAEVDYLNVSGGIRKRIKLKSSELFCNKNLKMDWIEGVGSSAHPFNPGCNMDDQACSGGGGYFIYTLCSFQNGEHIYNSAIVESNYCSLSVPNLNSQLEDIQLFPNPATDIVQINSQNTDILDNITVYDMLGKIVQKVNGIAAPQSILSVASLSKGIYLMEITTQNRMKATRKLMIK